jgi:hypothetical protein
LNEGVNESLSKTNKELDDIVKKLAGIEKSLKGIGSTAGKVPGAVRGATAGGGDRGLGTGTRSAMPQMEKVSFGGDQVDTDIVRRTQDTYSRLGLGKFTTSDRTLGYAQAGLSTAAGVLGGMYMAIPNIQSVMASSANYYGASLRSSGLGYQQITNMTMQGLGRLGITGEQSPAATAAILASRGVMPGSSQYRTLLGEIGGAARYMNMANENAALALSGFSQGPQSARLYAAGISTYNQATGQFRGGTEVFQQLYDRMTMGRPKASLQETMNSIQGGFLQQTAADLGMSEDQKQMFYQFMIQKAGGKESDLAKLGVSGNPLEAQKRIVQSDVETLNRYVEPMLRGMEMAADTVEAFNRGLQSAADQLGVFAGYVGGLGQSRAGAGLGVAAGSVLSGIKDVALTALAGRALLGKGGVKGGLMTAGKFLSKGVGRFIPGLGLVLSGVGGFGDAKDGGGLNKAGLFTSIGMGAATGAVMGAPAAGIGAIPGAVIGGVVGGLSYAGGYLLGGGGGSNAYAMGGSFGQGNQTQGAVSPIVGGVVGTAYGAKGSMWKGSHTGDDYPCPIGTPVVAALDGVVYSDNPGQAYGKTVQIDHGNGYQTLYGHLSEVVVKNGDVVKKGQLIGKSGDTGNVSGPHLHFEVRRGKNNPVNPAELKKAGGDAMPDSLAALVGQGGLNVGVSGVDSKEVKLSSLVGSGNTLSLLRSGGALVTGAGITGAGADGAKSSGSAGKILATGDEKTWATTLLQKLGAPVTESAIAALTTWARFEGGHWKNSANYNPLNTTYDLPGATSMNSVGVKRYNSWEQGFEATINTLTGNKAQERGYAAIVDALRSGASTDAILGAINNSAWVTGKTGGTPYKFQGGPSGLSVATPSISTGGSSGNVINIYASFAKATEAEALHLVRMVKSELEKDRSLSTMGRA